MEPTERMQVYKNLTDMIICAGNLEGGNIPNICKGTPGGPLVCKNSEGMTCSSA